MKAQEAKINPDTGEIEYEDIILDIDQNSEVIVRDSRRAEFEALCRPLIKFINDNYHPHVKAIIDCGGCELVEGLMGIPIDDYIRD